MKTILAFLPTLVLCLIAMPAPADSTTANEPMPPKAVLDNDERMQLMKVRDQVLAAHPDLKAEEAKLKQMHQASMTAPPSDAEIASAKAEWQAYQDKLRAEMLKIDPTLAPIFAKLDEAHKNKIPLDAPPATSPGKHD
jgi:hypothetical protein